MTYSGYEIRVEEKDIRITYHFDIPGLSSFAPYWIFPKQAQDDFDYEHDPTFAEVVFSLGMVELISYWKAACPPVLEIKAGTLSDSQIKWWKELYFQGLGEFFYTNGIEETKETFMSIEAEPRQEAPARVGIPKLLQGNLIPVGGGKDSIVTLNLLSHVHKTNGCYIINPRKATLDTVETAGYDDQQVIKAQRTLDPVLLSLNARGYLNGHTPFSAIVAFSATIAAYISGYHYIVLSNEDSANESTVRGTDINHQYSKSFAFEKRFHDYEKKYLRTGTYYFSLLRPWSEYQIARYFARLTPYHSVFRSCNVGSKKDEWCGHCAKCLFVALILSPFLSRKKVVAIFDRDILDDEAMIPLLQKLIGQTEEKPFECVGSRDEINYAAAITVDYQKKNKIPRPALLAYYENSELYTEYHRKIENQGCPYDTAYQTRNLLPETFARLLKEGQR